MRVIVSAVVMGSWLLLASAHAQDKPLAASEIAADKHGLLFGIVDTPEPFATSNAEMNLSLQPYPGMSTKRPYWLYVPSTYDNEKTAPIVIVLHPRGRLGPFSMGQGGKPADLEQYARKSLQAWQPVAESEGFLVAFPLGDPDILHMGRSWQTRDRILVVRSLLKDIAATHPYDTKRVYLVGSGEGGHVAVCTAVRHGDEIAAIVAVNPPLFGGKARRVRNAAKGIDIILPETIPEMLAHKSKRRVALLVLAGTSDKKLEIHGHARGAVPKLVRYQDTSSIPFGHMAAMVALLKESKQPIELRKVEGKHYQSMSRDQPTKVWTWLQHQPCEPPSSPVPPKNAERDEGGAHDLEHREVTQQGLADDGLIASDAPAQQDETEAGQGAEQHTEGRGE